MEQFQVGYRFSPTEEELINDHLMRKVLGYTDHCIVPELEDFYAWDPWDLPRVHQGEFLSPSQISNVPSDGWDWYFLCPSPYLAQNSERIKRKTSSGNWKITSQRDEIKTRDTRVLIGSKRILTFYKNRVKTGWILHEYHLNHKLLDGYSSTLQKEKDKPITSLHHVIPYVLCRLKRKPGESFDISPSFEEGDSSVTDDPPVAAQHESTEDTDQEVSNPKDPNLLSIKIMFHALSTSRLIPK
ncbi:hypothetical protein EUGRSUZ_G01984 [Eucalyptus grandis]|uniref:NAC domain-containing protein n=2 Tax=Eucalyptus grandis TaxID=71139 RepID=A0A059BFB2_EUCGR|nr:hypothetical protein EUGRSUZ_G01984 [Eucalyptus grandis]